MLKALLPTQSGFLLILLLAGFAFGYAEPIWDADFWWHLAGGRWIWEQQAFPTGDPFGVFGDSNPIRNDTVLKGQWLGQVLFYGLFSLAGPNGIVLFRVTLLLCVLGLLYNRLRHVDCAPAAALLMTALAGFCLFGYTGDRPQLLSIAFAALSFWVLDRAERLAQPKLLWLLPLLAAIWANSHGGVILGWVLLIGYALLGWWRAIRSDNSDRSLLHTLSLAVLAFGMATLITPNGWLTYAYILDLQGSELQQRTSEYVSALQIYQQGYWLLQFWVGIVLLLAVTSLLGLLRRDLRKAAVVGVLLLLSLESYRYLVFLLVIGLPYIALGLTELRSAVAILPWPRSRRWVGVAAAWLIVAVSLGLVATQHASGPRGGINSQRFPIQLSQQVVEQEGAVFNWMRWGGYLIWHNPKMRPYIDGRMLEDQRLVPYTHMLWASPEGRRWFDEARFDWVLIPYRDPRGEIYGLNRYLANHPQWRIFARGAHGYLYARR